MEITIAPHSWDREGQGRSSAYCFPFVDGKPCHEIADCSFCALNNSEAEICKGWEKEPDNAPLFCGPICDRFAATVEALGLAALFSGTATQPVAPQ